MTLLIAECVMKACYKTYCKIQTCIVNLHTKIDDPILSDLGKSTIKHQQKVIKKLFI